MDALFRFAEFRRHFYGGIGVDDPVEVGIAVGGCPSPLLVDGLVEDNLRDVAVILIRCERGVVFPQLSERLPRCHGTLHHLSPFDRRNNKGGNSIP